jgi:hypothetical protein
MEQEAQEFICSFSVSGIQGYLILSIHISIPSFVLYFHFLDFPKAESKKLKACC